MSMLRVLLTILAACAIVLSGCVSATDEVAASRLLGNAASSLPCVSRHDIAYNDVASFDGSLSGKIHVSDPACFESALRAIALLPDFNGGRPTTVYLIGILPNGDVVMPEAFGFPTKPLLRLLRERYAARS